MTAPELPFTLGTFTFNVHGHFDPPEQVQNIALNKSMQKSALFLTSTVQNVGPVASRQYFCRVCINLEKPRKEIKSKHGNTKLMSHLLKKIPNRL